MGNIIRFVQLEPSAFLTDPDFMLMSCQHRGVYCTLIFLLYCNNGKLEFDSPPNGRALGLLCNDDLDDTNISIILKKFNFDGKYLTHKRVSAELQKIVDFQQYGRLGAEKRWKKKDNSPPNSPPDSPPMQSKVKQSKVKQSKDNKERFGAVFKIYPSTKRGLDTEFGNFCKKHKDWIEIIPLLKPAIEKQIARRNLLEKQKAFAPEWKNFKTWINQRCWEEQTPEIRTGKDIKKQELCFVCREKAIAQIQSSNGQLGICSVHKKALNAAPPFRTYKNKIVAKENLTAGQLENMILAQAAK